MRVRASGLICLCFSLLHLQHLQQCLVQSRQSVTICCYWMKVRNHSSVYLKTRFFSWSSPSQCVATLFVCSSQDPGKYPWFLSLIPHILKSCQFHTHTHTHTPSKIWPSHSVHCLHTNSSCYCNALIIGLPASTLAPLEPIFCTEDKGNHRLSLVQNSLLGFLPGDEF